MMSRAQAKFDELEVLVACVMALAEIAYLHVEDLTVFIRRRTRFSPRQNRRIVDISGDERRTKKKMVRAKSGEKKDSYNIYTYTRYRL